MRFRVHEPTTLAEALAVLAAEGTQTAALAGGTDLLLRIRRRLHRYGSVVNIKCIDGMNEVSWNGRDGLTIGALTTFRRLETHATIGALFPALVEAARVVAGVQLRNLATVGGNLGNASPSADSLPPLVAFGATVDVASVDHIRTLPVEACIAGPGRTVLKPGELFTRIRVPASAARCGSAFARFSPRSAMDIGIASVAVSIGLDADRRVNACRIALGAVSATPLRAAAAEQALLNEAPTPALIDHVGTLAAQAASPITDIRASADYRRAIVGVLTRRMVAAALSRVPHSGVAQSRSAI
jgi:carbon-monoxide dehydrogenase medium subunit